MRAQNRAAPFVKPFRGRPDRARSWPSTFQPPLIHAHAVSDDGGLFGSMHGLAIFRAGLVSQTSAGHQAPRRLLGMVEGRQEPPIGPAPMNSVIIQRIKRTMVRKGPLK